MSASEDAPAIHVRRYSFGVFGGGESATSMHIPHAPTIGGSVFHLSSADWASFLFRRNAVTTTTGAIASRSVAMQDYTTNSARFLPLSAEVARDFLAKRRTAAVAHAYYLMWERLAHGLRWLFRTGSSHPAGVSKQVRAALELELYVMRVVPQPAIPTIELPAWDCPPLRAAVAGVTEEDDGGGGRSVEDDPPLYFPQLVFKRLIAVVNDVLFSFVGGVPASPLDSHVYYDARKRANSRAIAHILALNRYGYFSCAPAAALRLASSPTTSRSGASAISLDDVATAVARERIRLAVALACGGVALAPAGVPARLEGPAFDTLAADLLAPPQDAQGEFSAEAGGLGRGVGVQAKTVLYLADAAGDVVYDLTLARALAGLGHRVVFAVAGEEAVEQVFLADFRHDATLTEAVATCGQTAIFESDVPMLHSQIYSRGLSLAVIAQSTGPTAGPMDVYHATGNMMRAWRMAEVLISRSVHRQTLAGVPLTRDIYFLDSTGLSRIPRHPDAHLITRRYIRAKAHAYLAWLRGRQAAAAHTPRKLKVVFGSAIIGSLGESRVRTTMAISQHMEATFAETDAWRLYVGAAYDYVYINPATGYVNDEGRDVRHWEAGFDGDAMMDYWSIVQTSGVVDLWVFQSRQQIVRYYLSLPEAVREADPDWLSFWGVQDWRSSKGCMQEMIIARRVKRDINPSMVIYCEDADSLSTPDSALLPKLNYGIGNIE